MLTYRTETTISKNGDIVVRGAPFRPGEKVEVIILRHAHKVSEGNPYPLRGTPFRYDRPFDSVAKEGHLA